MFNTKFFLLISSFNSEERKKILDFSSKNTNPNSDPINRLLNYTTAQIEQKKGFESVFDRESVYKSIFPKEAYNEQKMNKLLSDGNKTIESFIVQQKLKDDFFYQKNALIEFYYQKGLEKNLETEIKQTENFVNSLKDSIKKQMYLLELNEKVYSYETQKNTRQSNFQKAFNIIQDYYEVAGIKIKNFSLINLHTDLEINSCELILYKIHLQINKLLHQIDSKVDYENCFQLILLNKHKIDNDDIKECITILIAIVIKQVHNNLNNSQQRLFDLYSFLIENNLILEQDNTITPAIYKNVTTIGLYLNKLDYVDNFIETYKNNLPNEMRDDVYSYNKAHLLYYRKDYNIVLQLISTTKYKDVFYRLSSRVLLIKTYYELEKTDATYFDILNNSINAFKKYVYTNEELNDYYKTRYKNFIKSVLKLIQLNNDKIQTQKYIEELNANKDILDHTWLLNAASANL